MSVRAPATRSNVRKRASSEHPDNDFPFYNGLPVRITGPQWLFVMLTVGLGFAALVAAPPALQSPAGQWVATLLYVGLPLVGLAIVAGRHWTRLFRKVGGHDVLLMFGFALLNIIVSAAVGYVVSTLHGAKPNPVLAGLGALGTGELVTVFARAAMQLVGEEVMSVLPFLALLYALHSVVGLSRTAAVVGSCVVTALLFGAAHLPTYGWDWLQCLVVIGTARVMLLLAYLWTKNLWVSTGAHIITDFTFFALSLGGAQSVGGTA
jgi:membrane protease YdiL (CAAX protease family)